MLEPAGVVVVACWVELVSAGGQGGGLVETWGVLVVVVAAEAFEVVVVVVAVVALEKVAVEKVAVVRELLWKACTAVVGGVCCIWAEHAVEQLGQHETLGQTEPPVGFCCVLCCCCWLGALRWWRLVEVLRWAPWVLVLELVLVLLVACTVGRRVGICRRQMLDSRRAGSCA